MCFETDYTIGKPTEDLISNDTLMPKKRVIGQWTGLFIFEMALDRFTKILGTRYDAARFVRELVIKCGSLTKDNNVLITDLLYASEKVVCGLLEVGLYDRKAAVLFIHSRLQSLNNKQKKVGKGCKANSSNS